MEGMLTAKRPAESGTAETICMADRTHPAINAGPITANKKDENSENENFSYSMADFRRLTLHRKNGKIREMKRIPGL